MIIEPSRVCSDCLKDPYLQKLISIDPKSRLACDYCSSLNPTMSFAVLVDRCQWLLDNFYFPAEQNEYTGEYEGDSLNSILSEELDADEALISAISETLLERWFDYNSYVHTYGDDPHFESSITITGDLSGRWSSMERKLQESNRFFNQDALQTFDEIFGYIFDNHPSSIVEFLPETTKLFRARVFQSEDEMKEAFKYPEASFGPPPSHIAPSGRMNARGISVFYGALDSATAISEVRPPVGSYVVVSEFNLLRPARLLDLTQLRSLSVKADSKFDPQYLEQYERCDFLRKLSRKLVIPIVPTLQESGYLLTQAIADYLSTHKVGGEELDGILFSSAQISTNLSLEKKANVIFFHESSYVKGSKTRKEPAYIELYNMDDGVPYYEPVLKTNLDEFKRVFTIHSRLKPSTNTLKINLDNIEIHQIRGVEYISNSTQVLHFENFVYQNPQDVD